MAIYAKESGKYFNRLIWGCPFADAAWVGRIHYNLFVAGADNKKDFRYYPSPGGYNELVEFLRNKFFKFWGPCDVGAIIERLNNQHKCLFLKNVQLFVRPLQYCETLILHGTVKIQLI